MMTYRLTGLMVFLAAIAVCAFAAAQSFAPVPETCIAMKAAGESGIYVNLSNEDSPEAILHIKEAVAIGHQPRILHWDPADADAHRRDSLRGFPTAPGQDRDEYPPASSEEGGKGADVRLIPARDNRTAGQRLGAVMHPYCPGTPFIIEP